MCFIPTSIVQISKQVPFHSSRNLCKVSLCKLPCLTLALTRISHWMWYKWVHGGTSANICTVQATSWIRGIILIPSRFSQFVQARPSNDERGIQCHAIAAKGGISKFLPSRQIAWDEKQLWNRNPWPSGRNDKPPRRDFCDLFPGGRFQKYFARQFQFAYNHRIRFFANNKCKAFSCVMPSITLGQPPAHTATFVERMVCNVLIPWRNKRGCTL